MTPLAATAAPATVTRSVVSSAAPALLQIRDAIYKAAGIFQADNKIQVLENRCQRRMQALGIPTLAEYYQCLTMRPMQHAEMVSLLNEITIGETCFFRNRPQLEGICKIVLPRIVEAKSKIALRQIRIWSAGCSTGEEPYTLAIALLEEAQKLLQGWTFEVIATDINENSIAHAQIGSYGNYSLRNTGPQILMKYFFPEEEGKFSVKPEVKSRVTLERMNLFDDARMMFMKAMDIILCCNVLIYFDAASKSKVIQHFYSNLFNHGYLFLGHAESLYGISDDFQLVHLPSTTAYVKAEKRMIRDGGGE
jgi:chemotaxis protein methyltransferase CheR